MSTLKCILLAVLIGGGMFTPEFAGAQQPPQVELRQIADRYYAERRYDEARPIYLQLLASNPRDFAINRNLGYCYLQGRRPDYARALQYLNAALAIEVQEDIQTEVARLYVRTGQPISGLQILQNLAGQHPQHPEHWKEYATQLEISGRQSEAIAAYQAYLERRPGDAAARLELGRLYSLDGKVPEAQSQFQMVLQSDPQNISGRIGLARLLAWQNRWEESLRLYNEVLEDSPRNSEALQGKGQVLVWLGRLDEAEPILQSLVNRFPNNPELRTALDDIRQRRERPAGQMLAEQPPETVESYQARIAQNSNDRDAHLWLGEYHAARLEWQEAVRHTLDAVRLQSDQGTLFRLGQLMVRSGPGGYAEAERIFRDVLAQNPSPEVALELGSVLRWTGRAEEALPLLEQALRGLPDSEDALRNRAHAYSALGRSEEAIRDFDRLLSLRADDLDALTGKAAATANQGDLAAAIQLLENARPRLAGNAEMTQLSDRLLTDWKSRQEQNRRIEIASTGNEEALRQWLDEHPDDADIAYRLSDVATKKGNNAEAVYFLQKALDVDSQMRPARLRLAQVLSFNGSYPDSLREYDRLIRDDPQDLLPLLESARVLAWSERYPQAAERYQRYLQAQPDPEVRFQLGRVYMWNSQYQEALSEMDSALREKPGTRDMMLDRGRTLAYMRRYPEAIAQYDQALALNPGDSELAYSKGQAYYWSGNLEEADRVLSGVNNTAPENQDARFTLASVAYARGNTNRALRLIPEATEHPESRNLRSNILTTLRPELQLSFAGEHGLELIEGPFFSTELPLKSYTGTARLGFWLTPEIHGQLQYDASPTFSERASFLGELGDSFVTNSLMFSATGRLNSRINWRLGGGGTVQSSDSEFLNYQAALGFKFIPYTTLTFGANRTSLSYTPRAAAIHLRQYEYTADWDTRINDRYTLLMSYARGNYSTNNHSNYFRLATEYNIPLESGYQIGLGYRYRILDFTRSINGGIFTPERYDQYEITGRLSGQLGTSALRYDLIGTIGPQNVRTFDGDPIAENYELSGTAGTMITWLPTENHTLGANYVYSNSALTTGAYRSHAFQFYWRVRF
ncbi:MAG: hypothetical protein A3F68_03655 [Acidobacteria bacterium RIFCSPLOWO2_12_FULL_54_10]|nr:MAG: hypothetical protein A3F68_03655 [Acidobacteria bacterium RIFCSPLOWO2_12_FULL_54_10]